MIKIQILKTGEVKEVTKNEAHGLIDAGLARMVRESIGYSDRQMKPVEEVVIEVAESEDVEETPKKAPKVYKTK